MEVPSPSITTTCSTPKNDSVEKVIKNEEVRYIRKGYGLISACLITFSQFFIAPSMIKSVWPTILAWAEPKNILFLGSIFSHLVLFIIGNLVMWQIYVKKIPFFERYRINPSKPWPWESDPDQWKIIIKKTIIQLFINTGIISTTLAFTDSRFNKYIRLDLESFPSNWEIIWQTVFFMIVEDLTFYWAHRLLHTVPWLQQRIHKKHHEYQNTISIASEYSHPLEFVFGNILPSVIGFKFLGSRVHFATVLMWLALRNQETIDGHCNYEFSWSPFRLLPMSGSSEQHSYHHSNNIGNYGSFFTYWDTLCGTNSTYFNFKSRKEREQALNQLRGEFAKAKEKMANDPKQIEARLKGMNEGVDVSNLKVE